MLSQDELKDQYSYNPETGIFTRLKSRGGKKSGCIAGAKDKLGYIRISIDSKLYLAHRLAFLYMEGRIPISNVDHRDGNPSNNSWKNLRECTQQQNIQNQIGHGKFYKNVYFTKGGRNKPFNVKIEHNGIIRSFGYYRTPEEADEVASLIRDLLHKDFSITNRNQNIK
jgi:hypothetical protein